MLPLQAVAELWALAFCRQRSDAAGGEGPTGETFAALRAHPLPWLRD